MTVGPQPASRPTGAPSDLDIADRNRDQASRKLGLWGLAAVGTALVVYFPVLFGQVLFFRDPANWTFPARFFVRKALLDGEAPTWNPLLGLGFPVLANPLYGLFYPPNWLYLLVPERLVVHMTTWQSLAHLIFGALGLATLLLHLLPAEAPGPGVDRERVRLARSLAAYVGAMAFGLSGYIAAQWTAGLLLLADAWVPWCGVGFLTLSRAAARPSPGAWARGILAAAAPLGAAFLLGEIFVAGMGAVFGLVTAAIARLLRPPTTESSSAGPAPWARLGALAAVALVLAAAVAMVTVLPAAGAASTTDRGQPLARWFAETASVHPIRLVELIAPQAMGVPYEDYPGGRWVNERDLGNTPLSYSIYLGATVLALAALAFGRRRWLAFGFAGAAAFFLIVALGKHTPVHHLLRTAIAPLAYMRYPEKYLVLVVCWVAVLAGLGAARLCLADVRIRRILGVAVGLGVLAGLAGLYPTELVPYVRRGALVGLGGVLAVAVAGHLFASRPRLAAGLLGAAVAGDLAAAAVPMQDFGPAHIATAVPRVVDAIRSDTPGAPAPPRAHRTPEAETSLARRFAATSHATGQARAMQVLVENASSTFGIALVPGYDAALPTTTMTAWHRGKQHGPAVLRLFGTAYVVLPADAIPKTAAWQGALEPVADPAPGTRLYRVRNPLPRAYVTGRADVLPEDRPMTALYSEPVLDGSLAYVSPGTEPIEGPPGRAGNCRIDTFATTELHATCHAERQALAVFLEQHHPGWSATLDGQPVPLIRVNRMMRGVRLAPGEHVIRLSYATPGLRAGAIVSSIGGLAMLGLLIAWRREASRPSATVKAARSQDLA